MRVWSLVLVTGIGACVLPNPDYDGPLTLGPSSTAGTSPVSDVTTASTSAGSTGTDSSVGPGTDTQGATSTSTGAPCFDDGPPCREGTDCAPSCVACTCGLDCGAANTCLADCDDGATCTVDCAGANNCQPTCSQQSQCTIDCQQVNNCTPRCEGASDCTIVCGVDSQSCKDNECVDGARCVLECNETAECAFKACDGVVTMCEGGVLVCNRPCP